MSDIFILYVAFSYLYMLGAVNKELFSIKSGRTLQAFVTLILAPVILPIVIGIISTDSASEEG